MVNQSQNAPILFLFDICNVCFARHKCYINIAFFILWLTALYVKRFSDNFNDCRVDEVKFNPPGTKILLELHWKPF